MLKSYVHVFVACLSVVFFSGPANAKLLHCWSFNGDPNIADAWADLVGNANAIPMGHATIKNNVLDLTANDGVNCDPCKPIASWVELPIRNSLEALEKTFTVECWFRWPNQMAGYHIWDFGTRGVGEMFLGTSADASVLHACLLVGREKTKTMLLGGRFPHSPQWQHSVFTYNVTQGIAEQYLNGHLIDSKKVPDGVTPRNVVFTNIYLGRCLPVYPMWNGLIDEIRIYDHAMSLFEVQRSYKRGPNCFNCEIVSQMTQSIGNADYKFSLKQYKEAQTILNLQIEAYSKWRAQHPLDEVYPEDKLPIIYYKLAKAEEILGEPNGKILKSYTQVFSSSNPSYNQEQTDALLWLLRNGYKNEYIDIITKKIEEGASNNSFKSVIRKVYQYCESSGNWPAVEQLLGAIAHAENGLDWCLSLDTFIFEGKWKTNCQQYFESHLVGNSVFYAEKAARSGNMADATAAYTDFLTRFGHTCDTNEIELKLCKCLFENREYGKTVERIEAFLALKQATSPRTIVKDAMLLNARSYIQLGELNKARDSFLLLLIDHQEAKESSEVSFLLGYCYMLQQKFVLAEDVFTFLIKEYPGSAYAKKAVETIRRIRGMSGQNNKH